MLWIVVTSDPEAAVQSLKKRVTHGCVVEATDSGVLPETIEKLGLVPGQVHQL